MLWYKIWVCIWIHSYIYKYRRVKEYVHICVHDEARENFSVIFKNFSTIFKIRYFLDVKLMNLSRGWCQCLHITFCFYYCDTYHNKKQLVESEGFLASILWLHTVILGKQGRNSSRSRARSKVSTWFSLVPCSGRFHTLPRLTCSGKALLTVALDLLHQLTKWLYNLKHCRLLPVVLVALYHLILRTNWSKNCILGLHTWRN